MFVCIQVSERALQFWDNDYFVSLIEVDRDVCVSIILPSLVHASNKHWNKTVVTMATDIINNMTREQKTLSDLLDQMKAKMTEEAEKQAKLNQAILSIRHRTKRMPHLN